MTTDQVKQILLAYRPWADDARDPDIAEALALCRQQAELQRWLVNHCAMQEALREKFRSAAPPAGLVEQIISERPRKPLPARWRRSATVAVLASVVILVALVSLLQQIESAGTEDVSFSGYRQRMVRTALKAYDMDLETNSLTAVRAFLTAHQSPAEFELPPALQETEVMGCGLLRWQGHPVTLVCFSTGKAPTPTIRSDLWLFVVADSDVENTAGLSAQRELTDVSGMSTASWRDRGKVYVLAGFDADEVRRRL